MYYTDENEMSFKKEFIEKYSEEEYNQTQEIIEQLFNEPKKTHNKGEWFGYCEVEKISQLQATYDISLYKPTNLGYDEEVNLSIASGIDNNGIIFYSLEGASLPYTKTVKVLKDVELDYKEYRPSYDMTIGEFKSNLSKVKRELIDNYNKCSYDKYVTGVFNFSDESDYESKLLKEMLTDGLKYKYIFEDLEIERY